MIFLDRRSRFPTPSHNSEFNSASSAKGANGKYVQKERWAIPLQKRGTERLLQGLKVAKASQKVKHNYHYHFMRSEQQEKHENEHEAECEAEDEHEHDNDDKHEYEEEHEYPPFTTKDSDRNF
jgi:hypothetical protein